jgi:acyl-CoA thioesterase-1
MSTKQKKILIITDSLGLPRTDPEIVSDDDTWVYQVMDYFSSSYKFRLFRHRGMDTTSLIHHVKNTISAYQDIDIVIFQVGIVDCYPRALSRSNLARIKKLPNWMQRAIHKIINRHYQFFVEKGDNRYVNPVKFGENLNVIKEHFQDSSIFILPIAPANKALMCRNRKVENSVREYNQMFAEIFKDDFLDAIYKDSKQEDIVLSDGQHLSTIGHRDVFRGIKDLLNDESINKN